MQTITINLIPNGIPERVYVNQYDVGRTFAIQVKDGIKGYVLPSASALRINGRKADNCIFDYGNVEEGFNILTIDSTNNQIIVHTTMQMVAAAGECLTQITIEQSGQKIGTLNFVMDVQEMPMATGDDSESDLPDIIALATEQMLRAEAAADNASASETAAASSASAASASETNAAASEAAAEEAATRAEAVEAHPPRLDPPGVTPNGNWWIWDNTLNPPAYKDSGLDAGVSCDVDPNTVTLPAGSSAAVQNTGTQTDPRFKFSIPQGAKGDKGDKGDTGAKGDKGDKGDTGAKGDKGDTGAKGDTGDTGAKGDKGDKGDTGPIGPTGDSQDVLEAVGWVGSNLFKGFNTVGGYSGITITRQNDKKYLVTGTNTSATEGKLYNIGTFTFKANVSYVIQGCPTGGGTASSNFWLGIYAAGTNTLLKMEYGEGRTYTPTQDTEADIKIRIPASFVCPANFIWDVMISRNGGEYVPYHPTVQEELWDAEVSEPKNVLPIKVRSTENITSHTIGDDGSITIVKSNTTTNRAQVSLEIPSTVTGNWYFKACPSGGGNNYDTYMWDSTASVRCKAWDGATASDSDYGDSDGHEVQLVAGHNNFMQLRLAPGYTTPAGGLTFYPMLSLYKGAYSPYYVPLKDSMFRRSEQMVLGAKNLWDGSIPSYINKTGTTRTKTSDGFEVQCVAQTSSGMWFPGSYLTPTLQSTFTKYGRVKFSCEYKGDMACAVKIGMEPNQATSMTTSWQKYEVEFDAVSAGNIVFYNNDSTKTPKIYIRNIMVRLASDPDDTYAPYAETNFELTQNKFDSANVAPTEDGAGASQAYSTGQYLIHNGELRKATTAIASGAEITDNNTDVTTLAEILESNKNELVSGIATLNGDRTVFDYSNATLDCVVNRFARRISISFSGVEVLQQLYVRGAFEVMNITTGYWGLIRSSGIATVSKDNTYYRANIVKTTNSTELAIVAQEAIPAGAVIGGYIEWPY